MSARRDRELKDLEREFNSPASKMPAETFSARREEIRQRYASQDDEARKADEAAEGDAKFVTFGVLRKFARNISEHVQRVMAAPINARVAGLERRSNAVFPAIEAQTQFSKHIERELDAVATRVSNVEFKTAALALNLARDPAQREQLANAESLLQRIAELESRLAALERE